MKNARRGRRPTPKKPTSVIGAGSAGDGFEADEAERVHYLELENDVLRGVADLFKAESLDKLTNREKTLIVDNLKPKAMCPLKELTAFLKISKSSHDYRHKAISRRDKHVSTRIRIREIFDTYNARWRPKGIWAKLRRGTDVAEQGECAGNLVKRNFHAEERNRLWLADITELELGFGKACLSPILDCFDGKIVLWSISQSPDAEIISTMLNDAIPAQRKDEGFALHSDGGVHHWWDCWIKKCAGGGIIGSMPKKACSPGNSACEGFFSRLKNEFFYCRDLQEEQLKNS